MLRACVRRAAPRALAQARRPISSIPSGGESFSEGHVLVTEQEQGSIVDRVREAAERTDFQHLQKDTRWIHWNETMADLIVRESLEAIQAEREADLARHMNRDRPVRGCGIDSHVHDCCCGGGEDEVGAPGTDIEPAGHSEQGAQA